MKAMIFAAGLGTRLKPFTDSHPKALAEVGGIPMLGLVINRLKRAGVREIVVNVHHFAQQIVDYIETNNCFGLTIHISDESDLLLDTGGGILAARQWLDGDQPFIVHNADILTDVDLNMMLGFHSKNHADASLLTAYRKTSRYLLFDNLNSLKGWENISTGELKPANLTSTENLHQLAFGGIHIISPRIFDRLEHFAVTNCGSRHSAFSIIPFYIDSCNSIAVKSFRPGENTYRWHDIGKPRSIEEADRDYRNKPF